MWLMTTFGYYSIVRKPWDRRRRTLTVRARTLDDLAQFRRRCAALGPTTKDTRADYHYRAQAPAKAVAQVIARAICGIDYDNFKDAVRQRDPDRAHVYAAIWARLAALQTTIAYPRDHQAGPTLFDDWDPPQARPRRRPRRRRLTR